MKKQTLLLLTAGMLLLSACTNTMVISGNSSSVSGQESVSDNSSEENKDNNDNKDSNSDNNTDINSTDNSSRGNTTISNDDMFTDRDMSGEYDSYTDISLSDNNIKGDNVTVSENTVTITAEGVYRLCGTLSEGQIIISAGENDKVQLVLDNCSITKTGSAPVYIKSADKVFITTAKNSENSLISKGEFVSDDENNVDGTVFSKSDITLNGNGTLNITCEQGHGVVTKDDLKITGGTVNVTSAKQGLSGKDSVRIAGGDIVINSGTDGIHSENEDSEKGYLYITKGNIDIIAGGDGIDCTGTATISGGNFNITSGNENISQDGSYKGIKVDSNVNISGGVFNITSVDDAVHTNGDVEITAGELTLSSGDDGIHGDNTLNIRGGKIEVTDSYEGIEGKDIYISGGDISINSSDDGLNAAGGNDSSGTGGFMPGGDKFGRGFGGMDTGDDIIEISGGNLYIRAEGDGIDSNGEINITGGDIQVIGPQRSGNGSIDFGVSAKISGGNFFAVGAQGMQENFSSDSTQGVIMYNAMANANEKITLKDKDDKVIYEYTPEISAGTVIISCPEIKQGESYTLTAGNNSYTIEMTSTVYGGGMGGNMGDHGGGNRPGGNFMDRPF